MMNHNSETFSLPRLSLKGSRPQRSTILTVTLSVLILALAVATMVLTVPASNQEGLSRRVSGVEADSARWQALVVYYAPDYERSAAASSVRYQALAESYGVAPRGVERGTAADSARWAGLAVRYAPDHERSAAASSARYQALAESYDVASKGVERGTAADAARWQALAVRYAPDYERSAAASSARYQALAQWHLRQARVGQ